MKIKLFALIIFFVNLYALHAQVRPTLLIHEDYEIPARGIYQIWSDSLFIPNELTIPFDENGKLKIILVEDNSPFALPCEYTKIAVPYSRSNPGVDFRSAYNDTAYCCFDGVVRLATALANYGKTVIVRHYNGLETVYANLKNITVQPNQKVWAGQMLGELDEVGAVPQLHFEVRFMNAAIDPADMIDFSLDELRSNVLVINNATATTTAGGINGRYHIVQAGETLSKIARDHNLSVEQLYQWNHLTENSILQLGQKIRVSE